MLKIYNRINQDTIVIDEKLSWVMVNLRDYDDPPHIIIDLNNGFDFMRHTRTCHDCRSFFKGLKSNSKDWLINFNEKKYFIQMNDLGTKEFGKNYIVMTNSEFNYGTRIQLEILKIDKVELDELELNSVNIEDYEGACLYRDLKKEI
jgi:hypothetical protein